MATKKKKPGKAVDEGFLTTAAQAIGSTLGELAKKAGVKAAAAPPAPAKKKAPIKKPAVMVKKKAVIKKK